MRTSELYYCYKCICLYILISKIKYRNGKTVSIYKCPKCGKTRII